MPDGKYYSVAVAWLKQAGITTGTTATTFSPDAAVTRAQMAAFLLRMVQDYGWTPVWEAR